MGIKILGSTSGSVEISAPAVAGNNTQYTLGNNSGMLIGTNDPNCVDGNMLSSTLDFKGKTLQSWPFGKNLEHALTYNYDVTAVTGAYVFGNSFDRNSPRFGNNVSLEVYEGDTVNFNVNAPGHPFYLKTAPGTGTGNQISGVTNNGADVGTVSYTFPSGSAGTYHYQCSVHGAMWSTIVVSTPGSGPSGKILKVQSTPMSVPTGLYSSYTSYTDSGVTATFTPTAATSKVLINLSLFTHCDASSSMTHVDMYYRLMASIGGAAYTELEEYRSLIRAYTSSGTAQWGGHTFIPYLHTPNTTSAITYKIQFKNTTGGYHSWGTGKTHIWNFLEVGA